MKIKIPSLSVVDRYLFLELLSPFLFGMGIFTSLGLSIGTLFDLVRRVTESGLVLTVAFQILLLKIPGFLSLAFPMAILLAALMAYSRLSSDSEIIALRSLGVGIYRLVIPVVIFGFIVTGCAFVVNDWIAPAATHKAAIILEEAVSQKRPDFKRHNIVYPEYKTVKGKNGQESTMLTRLFHAEEYNGEEMKGLTILDRTQEGVNQIVTSESATWNISSNTWDFFNGTIYLIAPDGSYRNIVRFQHQQLALPRAPLDLADRRQNFTEMTISETREYLKAVQFSGNEKRIRKVKVRLQEKYAMPFVCLIFGLVGASIGVKPQNTNRATSFGVCVGLIFGYYILAFMSTSLGIWGILTPFLGAWLPNIIGLGAGGLLLVKSASLK